MIKTPICDFVSQYIDGHTTRFHMPGHKGAKYLGFEDRDLTEIHGADDLYHPDGIIQESEQIASGLFGTRETCYGTEGSSQCIRAMLYLASNRLEGRPLFLAARNVHKAFIYGAALVDADIEWIYPETRSHLCRCDISPQALERALLKAQRPVNGVFITSPNYLGGIAEIASLAEVCHQYGTILMVDNAHGAYLHFLPNAIHPMDFGADICCDSAHKTLPVLTGGAYIHIAKGCPEMGDVKQAMELFGSSSPSYLIMQSLDAANRYLGERFRDELEKTIPIVVKTKDQLRKNGWTIEDSDPLRITINASQSGWEGNQLANILRANHMECEYADPNFVVLMVTPQNPATDFDRLICTLGENQRKEISLPDFPDSHPEKVCSVRQAIFAKHRQVLLEDALGKVCGAPTVSCPPAIPIVVSGERIDSDSIAKMAYYGLRKIDIVI